MKKERAWHPMGIPMLKYPKVKKHQIQPEEKTMMMMMKEMIRMRRGGKRENKMNMINISSLLEISSLLDQLG